MPMLMPMPPDGEAGRLAAEADFSGIRYAQCWEDADVLLEALAVRPGDSCLSIVSGGDNTLSLLVADPARVLAVDLSAAQLACLELRMAAYRVLDHAAWLELFGARPSRRRLALYRELRPLLSASAQRVWDARPRALAAGIGRAGRFERYLALFRRLVLPLAHTRGRRAALFAHRDLQARHRFFTAQWNNRRWRWLLGIFLSRYVMGRLGRDPRFFRYAEGAIAGPLLARIEHALTDLDPADNPYLHWIVCGTFGERLPHALRAEHHATIRARLDRVELHQAEVGSVLARCGARSIDRFNLSDVGEYLAPEAFERLLAAVAVSGRPGGRVAYWNMAVPRSRPAALAARLVPLEAEAVRAHAAARTFFYRAFVLEALV
jgi:S-adenosylmethionine-diacylglycerol 3-amino-3-carboxypropyl transferase